MIPDDTEVQPNRHPVSSTGVRSRIASFDSARAARWVFGGYLVVAFFLLVFHWGRDYWFANDDWGMLVGRSLGDVPGLFAPQNKHWSTFPIVVYQLLFSTVGLRSYGPYLAITVLLHLVLATLLRIIMRRAGVGPWVSTLVAGSFVLFGTGHENMLLAIQISMVGSMVFGCTHLLLADHDGPFRRQDALGLLAGALGLAASGVGVPFVMIVGLAVLVRRGWRMAFLHTAPLAALYGSWYFWQRSSIEQEASTAPVPFTGYVRWVWRTETGVFQALGQHRVVAVVLVVVMIGGLALAWQPLDLASFRRKAGMPLAMMVGAVALIAVIASQRYAFGLTFARSSRYLAMATALTLPALAVGADALVRRWRWTAPVVVLAILVGVPGNLRAFDDAPFTPDYYASLRDEVEVAAHSDVAREVPRDTYLDPSEFRTDQVTTGFLLDGADDGRIAAPSDVSDETEILVETRLSVSQNRLEVDRNSERPLTESADCQQFDQPLVTTVQEGDRFAIEQSVTIARQRDDGTFTSPAIYDATWGGRRLRVNRPHMTLRIVAAPPARSFTWCSIR